MNLQQLTDEVNNIYYNDTSSYKTIASIQKELLAILNPELDIKNIDRIEILKYFNYLKQLGNKPATINNKMMYLSKNLNYAYDNNLIKNRFKGAKKPDKTRFLALFFIKLFIKSGFILLNAMVYCLLSSFIPIFFKCLSISLHQLSFCLKK